MPSRWRSAGWTGSKQKAFYVYFCQQSVEIQFKDFLNGIVNGYIRKATQSFGNISIDTVVICIREVHD